MGHTLIAHLDLNGFFVAVERSRRPELLARIELTEEDRRILRELEHDEDRSRLD